MNTVEKLPEEQIQFYKDMGYGEAIRLNGKIVALGKFLFTCGIMVGMDEHGYECRYCYHNEDEAMIGLLAWIGSDDDEPSGYIKRK